MKQRFTEGKKSPGLKGILISILLSAGCICAFCGGINIVSEKNDEKELATLTDAINHAIIRCYSLESYYPPNLDYILDNYGISYDDEKYMVDYRVSAKNLYPYVAVRSR